MAIELKDKQAARLGSMSATLGNVAVDLDGTHAQPPGRTGVLSPVLQPAAPAFTGLFDAAPDRTGTIAVTLGDDQAFFGDTTSALADFTLRKSGPDVIWAHNFANQAEVDQFRWTGGKGNDPEDDTARAGTVTHVATGLSGGLLRCHHPVGNADVSLWWRPLAPIRGADNGIGTDDNGAGLLTPEAFDSSIVTETQFNWTTRGFYGWGGYDNGQNGSPTATFHGNVFFLQARMRIDAARKDTEVEGGKLLFLSRLDESFTNQELVFHQMTPSQLTTSGNDWSENYVAGYRGSPSGAVSWFSDGNDGNQPGSLYDDAFGVACQYRRDSGTSQAPSAQQKAACWTHSMDGTFDTYLFEIKAGVDGASDSILAIWAARQTDDDYIKIFDLRTLGSSYGSADPFGRNGLILSPYTNADIGDPVVTAFNIDHAETILSQSFIPAPQFYQNTPVMKAPLDLSSGQTEDLLTYVNPIPFDPGGDWTVDDTAWSNQFYYSERMRKALVNGKRAALGPYRHALYDLKANTFSSHNTGGTVGHIYSNITMDPETGDHYFWEWTGANGVGSLRRLNADTETWESLTVSVYLVSSTQDQLPQGISWHPNLYGIGNGGVVIVTENRILAWRKHDGFSEVIETHGLLMNQEYNCAEYLPNQDAVVSIGEVGRTSWLIKPGATWEATPLVTTAVGTKPDFNITAASSQTRGFLVLHPNQRELLALDMGDGTLGDVWGTTDGENWTEKAYTHPFTTTSQGSAVCSLPHLGAIWQFGSSAVIGTAKSVVWKVGA